MMSSVAISDIEVQVREAMQGAGVTPAPSYGRIAIDGKKHRYTVDGDRRGSKNGEYCIYLDNRPAGWIKDYKRNVFFTWAFDGAPLSKEENKRFRREMEGARREREHEKKEQIKAAVSLASEIWENSVEASSSNSYLVKKKVRPVGIRALAEPVMLKSVETDRNFKIKGGTLVIPLLDSRQRLMTLQFISEGGKKLFIPGSQVRGGFCPLGDFSKDAPILICEGWATGATLHQLTGYPIVAAMNAGNLGAVAGAIRKSYGHREMYIAADNDHRTEGNPGVTKASQVGEEMEMRVFWPDFTEDEEGTDWNDFYILRGSSTAMSALMVKIEEFRYEEQQEDLPPLPEASLPELPMERFYSDLSNAELFVQQHGGNLCFCHAWRSWLVWDESRWCENAPYLVTRKAIKTVRSMHEGLNDIFDDKERQALLDHIRRSESKGKLDAMKGIAQDLPGIPVRPEDLDANPWLLNCASGTLDIKEGKVRGHRREDLMTKMVPYPFDPTAQCPKWKAFLGKVMGGDQNLIEFLQRAVGYCLTGSTEEHCLFVLYGTGRNGKSTFLNTVKTLMGDYARQAAADAFMAKKSGGGGPSDEIAALRGARFVTAIETEENQRLAEALVKQLTGGDSVMVRRLYENYFEFTPEFKLFLATNHKPNIRGTDHAIWKRIRLVPFTVTISEEEKDPELPQKLKEELPGIFAWAVKGCMDWKRHGLGAPEAVMRATEDYRSEMDIVGTFLSDCCTEAPNARVPSGALYQAYCEWCEEVGERKISQRTLGRRLKERGLEAHKGAKGKRYWLRLGLLDEFQEGGDDPETGSLSF